MTLWFFFLGIPICNVISARTNFVALNSGIATISSGQIFKGVPFSHSEMTGKTGHTYYGIRYGVAERFENSVMNTDFSYLDNPDQGPPRSGYACPQVDIQLTFFPMRRLNMSEDCLYLDVYVPPINEGQTQTFPVMFWIYGGGFFIGDKDLYDASFLSADIKVVVITINYRLGAFGFLSSGDDLLKGNWAIGDIKLALEFIRMNINAFGGDPEKITIFGQSAGGALTSAMMLDDKIRSTVQAAIAMSGSMVATWAVQTTTVAGMIFNEAFHLECPIESPAKSIECLKKIPFMKFIEPRETNRGAELDFGPVIDGIHIKGHPFETIQQRNASAKKEATFISGYLKEDASSALYSFIPEIFKPGHLDFTRLEQIVAMFLPQFASCPVERQPVLNKIYRFFNISETDDEKTLLSKLIMVVTDITFAYPSIRESIAYASRSFSDQVPNYQYLISYDPKYQGWGAFHEMDTVLIFRGYLDTLFQGNPIGEQATESMRNFLRLVAYTGKPDGAAFGESHRFMNLNLVGKWEAGSANFHPMLNFWDEIALIQCPDKNNACVKKIPNHFLFIFGVLFLLN